MWNGSATDVLSTPGATKGLGLAINNSGDVAGYAYNLNGAEPVAMLWHGGTAVQLSPLYTGSNYAPLGVARGINDAGQIVGSSVSNDGSQHATLWSGSKVVDMGTLGNDYSVAYAINNVGQVAGISNPINSQEHATLWDGSSIKDLGTLGGTLSNAYALNDKGQVVGFSFTANNAALHATLWSDGAIIDLGSLYPDGSSMAYGINNTGQIVGAYSSSSHGTGVFLAQIGGAGMIDLNSLLDAAAVKAGWLVIEVNGINDAGSIAGMALNTISGESHAVLLTVSNVPEPAALWTFLLGLTGLVCVARIHKSNGINVVH